jgi:hypothetical protein
MRGSRARAPFDPVVLLIGTGGRVDYLCTRLRRLGGFVATAPSVSDAASLLKDCSSFDAIVLNAESPQQGWGLAQALRKVSECAAPVWIVTSHGAGTPLRRQACAAGVQFFHWHEGVHRLLETLIRRTLQRLVGLTFVLSELLQTGMSVGLLLNAD